MFIAGPSPVPEPVPTLPAASSRIPPGRPSEPNFWDVLVFQPGLPATLFRLAMVIGGLIIVMTVIKVAYMRAKEPPTAHTSETSPWALLSYALFTFTPLSGSIGHMGDGVPLRSCIYLLAVGCGLVAVFNSVQLTLWAKRTAATSQPGGGDPEGGHGGNQSATDQERAP